MPYIRHFTNKAVIAILAIAVSLFEMGCGAPLPISRPEVRYIAFGDSTTDGSADKNYHELLPSLLGISASAIANEGKSGEETGDGLDRLCDIFSTEKYPNATTLLYWEGGNDLTQFIQANDPFLLTSPDEPDFPYEEAFSEALNQTQAIIEAAIADARNAGLDVFVATYFPLAPGISMCDALPLKFSLPEQTENGNVYVDFFNERLHSAAQNAGATIVPIARHGAMLTADPDHYEDCNHLSETGNAIVAELFADTIRATNDSW